jgi:ketosteroid isomerase-like protein
MKIHRLAVLTLAAVMAFFSVPGAGVASDSSDVMTVVHQVGIAFNKGDLKAFAALCDSPASIIDDFPPHTWSGPTACRDWAMAFAAFVKKNAISNSTVIFGAPWHDAVTGDRAYVVVPASLRYNQNGRPKREIGSVLTIVLRKTAAGWRMISWSWAQH